MSKNRTVRFVAIFTFSIITVCAYGFRTLSAPDTANPTTTRTHQHVEPHWGVEISQPRLEYISGLA